MAGNREEPPVLNRSTAEAMGMAFNHFLQTMQANGGGGNATDHERVVERFRRFRPPTFNGRDGPAVVEEWFRALERIFRTIQCGDASKIACATFQLVEDADHWWEGFWRSLTEDEKKAMTWDLFKTEVMNQYFPQSYRNEKETEFLNLKQGTMTTTEYERKFNELSRFAPHLVDDDAKRASRFERGLRPQLAGILAAQGDLGYYELVRRAHKVEVGLKGDEVKPNEIVATDKRKWNGDDDNNSKQQRTEGDHRFNASNNKPLCRICGKHHYGVCMKGQNKCFRCHQQGHESRDCPVFNKMPRVPQAQQQNGGGQRTGGNARMYVMGHGNAGTNPRVNAGNEATES